jgi:hypothetical protein
LSTIAVSWGIKTWFATAPPHETNSLYNLLTVAYDQGLYTGNAAEYDTPYSNP